MLVLDSNGLPLQEQIEAVSAALQTEVPYLVNLDHEGTRVRHTIHYWSPCVGVGLLQQSGSGVELVRGPRQLRVGAPERAALALQISGSAFDEQPGVRMPLRPSDLILVDQTQTQHYHRAGWGAQKAIVIDYPNLGLTADLVRAAKPNLRSSPLYGMVRSHLAGLDMDGDTITPAAAQQMIGTASAELVRALIVTALPDRKLGRGALRDTLYARLRFYLEAHLGDRGLSVERVARIHNVSLRQLYKIWSVSDPVPVVEWIMERRLERARAELSAGLADGVTIADIAHRWGFADVTHFGRRFRAAFGVTPGEWRAGRRGNDTPEG